MKNLKKAGMPIQPKLLKAFLEKSCEQFRHKLVKEYEIFKFFIICLKNTFSRCF